IGFMQEMNATVYRRVPGVVTIAEESTAWPGVTKPTDADGLGFGLKWNMGWMNDTLRYLSHDPIHRQYHHGEITFSIAYAFSENFVLPLSHDEVVHGKKSLLRKMPGDRWQQLATVRALLGYQWAHPGKKLLFMGSEFSQEAEWAESRSLDWWLLDQPDHAGLQRLVGDLNRTLHSDPALWERDSDPEGFAWITGDDAANNVLAFERRAADGAPLVAVVNFSPNPHENYRLGLPASGPWNELINTDSEIYGGSDVGNLGQVVAEPLAWHGREHSVRLRVPPLGGRWLRPAQGSRLVRSRRALSTRASSGPTTSKSSSRCSRARSRSLPAVALMTSRMRKKPSSMAPPSTSRSATRSWASKSAGSAAAASRASLRSTPRVRCNRCTWARPNRARSSPGFSSSAF